MKTVKIFADGQFDGGPTAVMSVMTMDKLFDFWNSLRNSQGFPYLQSNFENLTVWEFVIFTLDPNVAVNLKASHLNYLKGALSCCGLELYSQLSDMVDKRAKAMCREGKNERTLNRHRNVKHERVHVMAIQLQIALRLWNRARQLNKTETQLKQYSVFEMFFF